MTDQFIELVAYDPTWPGRFAEQRMRLAALLKSWFAGEIEHVGSTAVPGLRSEPIVDILEPVQSLAASRTAIPILKKTGGFFGRTTPMTTIVSGSCDRALRCALIISKSSNAVIRIFEH